MLRCGWWKWAIRNRGHAQMWMVEVGNKEERTCSDVDGGSGQ